MKVLLGVFAVGFVSVVAALLMAMGVYNTSISLEAGLEAQYKQNQNNYDNYYKKVIEASGVSDKYAEDVKNMYSAVMTGRYGEEGSKAMFQMLTEQNPQVTPEVYTKIQQIIEAGRESFAADQKTLLDKKRVYETYLGQMPNGLIAKIMGFPKKDIASFDIVTSGRTEEAFKTKKDEPIDLKPKETK